MTGRLLTFTLAAALLVIIPGPSVLFIVGRALALGRRAAVLTAVGNAGGVLVVAAAVAVGLGPLLARSESLLLVARLVGAAYLVVLGVCALRARRRMTGVDPPLRSAELEAPGLAQVLREGFLVGVTNPKSLVFFSAVLPQLVDQRAGEVPLQLALLGLVFVLVAVTLDSAGGMAAGTARDWSTRDERRLRRAERAGGIVLVGLGGGLDVEWLRRA